MEKVLILFCQDVLKERINKMFSAKFTDIFFSTLRHNTIQCHLKCGKTSVKNLYGKFLHINTTSGSFFLNSTHEISRSKTNSRILRYLFRNRMSMVEMTFQKNDRILL